MSRVTTVPEYSLTQPGPSWGGQHSIGEGLPSNLPRADRPAGGRGSRLLPRPPLDDRPGGGLPMEPDPPAEGCVWQPSQKTVAAVACLTGLAIGLVIHSVLAWYTLTNCQCS